jgi:hypothetical protein
MDKTKADTLLDVLGTYITARIANYHQVQMGIGWYGKDERTLQECESALRDAIADAIGEKASPAGATA